MDLLINILQGLYVVDALLMMFVILMQRPKSEGLGAAFGGGVTENIFGAQTTNVLVKFTGYLAAIFFGLTFALSILYAKRSAGDSALRQELMKTQAVAPAASPAAAGSPQASPAGPATAASAPRAASGSATVAPAVPPAAGAIPPASVPVAPATAPAPSAPAQASASPAKP